MMENDGKYLPMKMFKVKNDNGSYITDIFLVQLVLTNKHIFCKYTCTH